MVGVPVFLTFNASTLQPNFYLTVQKWQTTNGKGPDGTSTSSLHESYSSSADPTILHGPTKKSVTTSSECTQPQMPNQNTGRTRALQCPTNHSRPSRDRDGTKVS